MSEPVPLCICASKPPLHDRDDCPAAHAELEAELAKRGIVWSEQLGHFVQDVERGQ